MFLESQKIRVLKPAHELFNILSDVKSYRNIMPENIIKFEVLGNDEFKFALKGMPEITLKFLEKIEFSKIILGSVNEKLLFTLRANIDAISENESGLKLTFDGEFNSMISMMIKKPLGIFIETLAKNISKL